jgi:anti-anti-sigma regulatory factor
MLKVDVQTLGGVAIFRCQGRIVADDESTILRNAVRSEANYSALILDLAVVAGIDAGGLGALLGLHAWARSNRIQLRCLKSRTWIVFLKSALKRSWSICCIARPGWRRRQDSILINRRQRIETSLQRCWAAAES